jgi:hypothetical protein
VRAEGGAARDKPLALAHQPRFSCARRPNIPAPTANQTEANGSCYAHLELPQQLMPGTNREKDGGAAGRRGIAVGTPKRYDRSTSAPAHCARGGRGQRWCVPVLGIAQRSARIS